MTEPQPKHELEMTSNGYCLDFYCPVCRRHIVVTLSPQDMFVLYPGDAEAQRVYTGDGVTGRVEAGNKED